MTDIFGRIRADFSTFLDSHGQEIAGALDVAGKVAASPLARVALELVHMPPATQAGIAAAIQAAEADFQALAEVVTAPAAAETPPAAGEAAGTPPELADPAAVVPAAHNAQP